MAWKQSDRVALRRYLNATESALIEEMKSGIPSIEISYSSRVEGVALSGAEKQGWENAIKFLKSLSENTKESDDASSGTFEDMSGTK